jgi:hypothetical protein
MLIYDDITREGGGDIMTSPGWGLKKPNRSWMHMEHEPFRTVGRSCPAPVHMHGTYSCTDDGRNCTHTHTIKQK